MIINTFTGPVTSPYAAMDTETHMYVDGEILPTSEITRMCRDADKYPVSWWREHTTVRAWAYIVYAPEGFAIAENFDEFIEIITRYRIKTGWWYNAPFDFSILDYDMLSRGWTYADTARSPGQYSELANDFGCRYSMTLNIPYHREKGDRSRRKSWRVKMYDLRNILHGGLEKLLKDFCVTDADGNDIRKLSMDYQLADGKTPEEIEYMRHDAAGLWWLIDKASRRFEELYGYSIRFGKPDILTASGLAKRVVFDRMYPFHPLSWQKEDFRRQHPMRLEEDTFFREHGLLGGGLVLLNPDVKGRTLYNWNGYRYDVNSEYPFYMANMLSVWGSPTFYVGADAVEQAHANTAPTDCRIYIIDRLDAKCRPWMIPAWRDPFTGTMRDEMFIGASDHAIAMFEEELLELGKYWYDIREIVVEMVVAYKTRKERAIEDVMREEYARKAEARQIGDDALSSCSKLIMNGYGGKYSQNPRNITAERRIMPDGCVHFVETGEEIDEKSIMHVVQGARITCGGRVYLRRLARAICGDTGIRQHLAYTDTDSIHADVLYDDVSATELGKLKRENKTPITEACFLAPKSYYEIEASAAEYRSQALAIEAGAITVHAKGVRTEAIVDACRHGAKLKDIYKPGYRLQSLSALNVQGGKALLPLQKQICASSAGIDETYE